MKTPKKKSKRVRSLAKKKKWGPRRFIFSRPEGKFRSQLEKKIFEKIRALDETLDIRVNEKKIAGRMELDLYFPEYNLGLEIQGPTHTVSPEVILRDHRKKIASAREGIEIIYIYTDSARDTKACLDKCSEILKRKKDNKKCKPLTKLSQ